MRLLNSQCIRCLLNKYMDNIPETAGEEAKVAYIKRLMRIILEADENTSAPEAVEQVMLAREEILGVRDDYTREKAYYNAKMLALEEEIEQKIVSSSDPFRASIGYCLAGNYIDFGTVQGVEENRLMKILEDASRFSLPEEEVENLRRDCKTAKRLVILIDNCGEIVLDKILLKTIRKINPAVEISAIVRGAPVLNDCTAEDAEQVGLRAVARVISNGTAVAGTCFDRITREAREAIVNADVVISKGQGNFETLSGSGRNVYYLFLCKCHKFSVQFGVPEMSAMLVNDKRL